nr:MAG TPA: hypothetical protein [Caudoviricetes sp.]
MSRVTRLSVVDCSACQLHSSCQAEQLRKECSI